MSLKSRSDKRASRITGRKELGIKKAAEGSRKITQSTMGRESKKTAEP